MKLRHSFWLHQKKREFVPKILLHYFGMRVFPSMELHPKTLIYIKKCSIYGGKTIYAKLARNFLLLNGWKFAWKSNELFLMDNLTSYINYYYYYFSTRWVYWNIKSQKIYSKLKHEKLFLGGIFLFANFGV
jgi:hypothetical protein